jgi:chaperonin cofactor prefoldin
MPDEYDLEFKITQLERQVEDLIAKVEDIREDIQHLLSMQREDN